MNTRWHDNDVYGHVNNTVYYSFFDTAANRYLIDECGLEIDSSSVVAYVVASRCDYFRPIVYPNDIEIGFRVSKLGNKSVVYQFAVFSALLEEACALGSFTHVFVERDSGSSVEIPTMIRSQLEKVHK